jgi:hypothetical protein
LANRFAANIAFLHVARANIIQDVGENMAKCLVEVEIGLNESIVMQNCRKWPFKWARFHFGNVSVFSNLIG